MIAEKGSAQCCIIIWDLRGGGATAAAASTWKRLARRSNGRRQAEGEPWPGRGAVKIMEELMDDVRIETGEAGTTITMVKRRAGSDSE